MVIHVRIKVLFQVHFPSSVSYTIQVDNYLGVLGGDGVRALSSNSPSGNNTPYELSCFKIVWG